MTQVAGYVASAISLFSILSCFVHVPYMVNKLGNIRTSLDLKMDEFKVLESDVWSEIMQARVNVPKPRKERQAGPQCNCDSTDRCPPGPPGASGTFFKLRLKLRLRLWLRLRLPLHKIIYQDGSFEYEDSNKQCPYRSNVPEFLGNTPPPPLALCMQISG
jgi:hypothetical protein